MALSAHSTLREILANQQAKAVLEKHLPGATAHPDLPMALHMSLREASFYPEAAQAGLTQEKLQAIDSDLKALSV